MYVDNSIDEPSLDRNNQDNDFDNHNLTNIKSITSKTQAVNDNQVITKAYVDQFHQDNEQSRRDLGIHFYDESSDLVKNNQVNDLNDNKLTKIDSVTLNTDPSFDNELSRKKYVDHELDKNTMPTFNETLEHYLKTFVGNDTYNLTKYNKIQFIDTTVVKHGNGQYLLPQWKVICNDKTTMV